MNPQLKFGDIFVQGESEYIYLGNSEDITYVAKILDTATSREVERMFFKNVIKNKATTGPLYSFIKLESHDYYGRIASLINPIINLYKHKKISSCENNDKTNLREEILASRGVPLGLKELFSS